IGALGDLTMTATDTAGITAEVVSASVAVSFGAVAIGGAGAGATTRNRIKTTVESFVDGTDPGKDGTGPIGVSANSISIHATDGSTIHATTASAALALSDSILGGVAVSIGVALAKNDIANDVEAFVMDAGTVHATGTGGIEIKAASTA